MFRNFRGHSIGYGKIEMTLFILMAL